MIEFTYSTATQTPDELNDNVQLPENEEYLAWLKQRKEWEEWKGTATEWCKTHPYINPNSVCSSNSRMTLYFREESAKVWKKYNKSASSFFQEMGGKENYMKTFKPWKRPDNDRSDNYQGQY